MEHQVIKIYNSDDFKRITRGIKVAQCMEAKDSGAELIVNNLDDLTISDALSCSFCDTTFENKAQQRLHYKLDWHRYNLKQRLQGLKSVSEETFDLLDENSNSTSASDDETDGEMNDSSTSSKSSKVIQKSEKNGTETLQDSPHKKFRQTKDSSDSAVRHTKVFFENEEGNIFSIYKCLLYNRKEVPEIENEVVTLALESGKRLLWSIIMVGGGHFAAAVFSNGVPVVHKTYHTYTCRAKQGSMQHSRDNYNGLSHPKSAGANLRRSNEMHLVQHAQDVLESWSQYIASSSLILYRAVGVYNRNVLFGGKNAPLDKSDSRLRTLPFPTRKPTFKELKRVHDILSNVEIYGSASNFVDTIPQSINRSTENKNIHEALEKQKIQQDNNCSDNVSPINNKSEKPVTPEKHGKNRKLINRGKERKSPVRPLPDIVMKLAQSSSSESEFDSKDHTDTEINIIEHDVEVDFSAQLQCFDNSLPRVSRKKQNVKQRTKRDCAEKDIEGLTRMKVKLWTLCENGNVQSFSNILKELSNFLKLSKKGPNVKNKLKINQNNTEDSNKIYDMETIINESDNNGNTMLHLASANGYTKIAQCLLKSGSSPHIKNKNSDTPYDVAADRDTRILFENFRRKGTNLSKRK